jgi:3',5'-cyclic AMP phosphodiesterase CpdA
MGLRRSLAALITALSLGAAGHPPAAGMPETPTASRQSRAAGPTVVAVGDIACAPGKPTTRTSCRERDTARLAARFAPRRVLALGDLQYPAGSLRQFRHSYRRSWGALKSVTRPIPGNHEYLTPRAAGYYEYFRRQRPGYYAFDVGGWRVYALNSNCSEIDCAREERWLRRDLVADPRRCTAVMMHHPLYSSGNGETPWVRPFWRVAYRHGADIALAGHDHHYERFRRMNAVGGVVRDGIQSFVVGTGGRSLFRLRGARAPGSAFRDDRSFGVLALTLGRTGWGWSFRTTGGRVLDSGTGTCR